MDNKTVNSSNHIYCMKVHLRYFSSLEGKVNLVYKDSGYKECRQLRSQSLWNPEVGNKLWNFIIYGDSDIFLEI